MVRPGPELVESLPEKLTWLPDNGARLSQVGTAVALPTEELMVKSSALWPQNMAIPRELTAMICTRAWLETTVDGISQEPEEAEPGAK